jgi:hypothetical protein
LDIRSERNYKVNAASGVVCGGISDADFNQQTTVSRKLPFLARLRLSGFNRRVF